MAENFDPIFTRARVELTPLDRNALMILQHMNTADFAEFDWVNPDYQPIVDPPLIWSPFNNQLSLSLSIGNKRQAKNFKLRATRGLQATWHSPLGRERETYIPWLLIGDITTFRLITVRPSWSLPLLCQQKKNVFFFPPFITLPFKESIYIYIPTVRNHDVRSCQVVMLYVIIYSILLLVELLLLLFFPPHFWYWLVYFSNLYLPSKSGLLHAYRFSDFINCYATIGWDKCTTTTLFFLSYYRFYFILSSVASMR